ncbi:anthranilate phosphoribosyltransferase [Neisseria sp. Ec49-e6-T10]|uniref:anthranilate phosphoribosyltransferase n=1 Tax=Neisseria sp. Ec49-e6-T10 TaxID=3140744 RepID=UPI003EBA3E46
MTFTAQDALNRLIDGNELFYDEMVDLMRQIMKGELAPEVVSAILIGLRTKVESVSEIAASATVLREFATPIPVKNKTHLLDIVGTGGDKAHTFNISTTSMFVAAAAGARVAKHGGRGVSSSSGSADVLETMGVNLNLTAQQVADCIDQLGLGFMFSPNYHSAMRHVAPIRKALAVRTIFNILGPLINPAHAPNQLMGVFHPDLVGIQARVLKQLGSEHVMIVHGEDGLDEITITAPTLVAELKDGSITEYKITPEEFGLQRIEDLKPLKVNSSTESYLKVESVLAGEKGPCRDIVVLNSAAALYCANIASDFKEGVQLAHDALDSGAAKKKQLDLIEFSQKQTV